MGIPKKEWVWNSVVSTTLLGVIKFARIHFCFFTAYPKRDSSTWNRTWEVMVLHHEDRKSTLHNRTPHSSLQNAASFIDSYTQREGLSLPGRGPGCKSFRIKLLHTSTTKAELWRLYKHTAEVRGYTLVGYTKFVQTRNDFIKIMQPSMDPCHTCQENTEKTSGCSGVSEEDETSAIEAHQNHLRRAKPEWEIYNSALDASKDFIKWHQTISLLSGSRPSSLKGTVHYFYDYAQQVHYPSNPQQPAPIYFKTLRKCGIFGICCESLPRQMKYLIDESFATGKGANATISYVHNFLKNHGAGETDVHLHADNCGGNNKHKYVLWYWCWRFIHRLHESVRYSSLVAGHMKFSPDWCSGLMKQRLRRTFISSLFDILKANDKSTLRSVNCGKLVGLHDGSALVKTYDWVSDLASYFKKLRGISKLYHFRLNRHDPGKVFYREYADLPDREFQLLKDINRLPPCVLPLQVLPGGVDEEQRRYLHHEICEFSRPGTEYLVAPAVI